MVSLCYHAYIICYHEIVAGMYDTNTICSLADEYMLDVSVFGRSFVHVCTHVRPSSIHISV